MLYKVKHSKASVTEEALMSRPFENINIPASKEMKQAVKKVARENFQSSAGYVRRLIKEDLDRRGIEVPDHVSEAGEVAA